MSYRKIEVDGKVFEYSIGKTHTKIRHVGAFKNEEVGQHVKVPYVDCYDRNCVGIDIRVRPSDLVDFIRHSLSV